MKPLAQALALALFALSLAAACTPSIGSTATASGGGTTGGGTTGGVLGTPRAEPASLRYASTSSGTGSGQEGIWVVGSGTVTLAPDLARLTLGVEAQEETVALAQAKAATALDAIIARLRQMGVAEKDTKTQHFSIQPIINYERVLKDGREYTKQRIDGYQVTNTLVASLRDLKRVGEIIDAVAKAGGDLTRIHGIGFTVEDPAPAHTQARALATQDAVAKARQFAQLLSIELGKPVFVTELGGGGPIVQDYAEVRTMAVAEAPTTPISPGELEVTAQVQIVFAIP